MGILNTRGGSHERQPYVTTAQHSFLDQSQSDRRRCRDFGGFEIGVSRYYARDVTVIMSLLRCDPPATVLPKLSVFFVNNDVSIVETMTAAATFSLTRSGH